MLVHSAAIQEHGQASVLVADDEEPLRDIYRQALESRGYRVALAADGQAALETYRRTLGEGRPFDAVLLDLCMPGMGGLECARAILEANPWARIIIATGNCAEELHGMVDRLAGVLLKPISLKTLLREISVCLESPALAPG